MTATPAAVGPGFVARVRASGHVYTSARCTRDEATAVADRLLADLAWAPWAEFPAAGFARVTVLRDRVTAVEVVAVNGHGPN